MYGYQKIRLSDTRQRTKLPRLLSMFVIILLVLQVVISNRLATTGIKIAKIETDIELLTQENADIKQQIASASALRTIESKAKQLGFTQTVKPIYLDSAPTVAIGMQ